MSAKATSKASTSSRKDCRLVCVNLIVRWTSPPSSTEVATQFGRLDAARNREASSSSPTHSIVASCTSLMSTGRGGLL